MMRAWVPLPRDSSEPEAVTERVDTRKTALMTVSYTHLLLGMVVCIAMLISHRSKRNR